MAQQDDDLMQPENSNTPTGLAQRWKKEIEGASKEQNKWQENARKIVKRYLDKRDGMDEHESHVNIFWSTIETLKATLYARPPKADVSRTYVDPKDEDSRVAAEMLERILIVDTAAKGSDFDSAARHGIEDWLIVGLGQMWMRYEVKTRAEEVPAVIDPMTGQELVAAQTYEVIEDEKVISDYVFWEDFFWSPARVWQEVRWVARRVYLTKEQAKNRFGEKIAGELNYTKSKTMATARGEMGETPQNDPWSKAEIFEIWDRDTKKVYWYSKGVDVILDVKDDPLGLQDFFPCPKPAIMNVTTSNVMPRPLYVMAEDQFKELNELNTRIRFLTKAAKVAGGYDKAADGLQKVFQETFENQLVPLDNWAMFSEKGGIKGSMDFIPIDPITNAIERLRVYRQDKTQQIYEVLGISDIMRGSTMASESATAQSIKAQYGSTRLAYYQNEIARWVRECLRIKVEIIAAHFQPETIVRMSNIMTTSDAEYAQGAVSIIKNMNHDQYRVDVDVDSMAAVDWQARQQEMTTMLSALANYFAQITPVIQSSPQSAPYFLQIAQVLVANMKGASKIEAIFDKFVAMASQPPAPPQPDPMQQAEVENVKAQAAERFAKAEKVMSETPQPMAPMAPPVPPMPQPMGVPPQGMM